MKTHRFSRLTKAAYLFSLVLLVLGALFAYFYSGIQLGIDFESGLMLRYRIAGSATASDVEAALAEYPSLTVRRAGSENERQFLVRVSDDASPDFQSDIERGITETLLSEFGSASVQESAFVGPSLSSSLRGQTVLLIAATLILILAYLWFRFHIHFAFASVIALLHDVMFVVLFVALTGIEVTAATIAAVLTVIGYSLNDTIVVFDRIRENRVLMQNTSLQSVVDTSVSQSLSRTIITSLTTMLAAVAIIVFARDAIRDFAMTLAFGVLVGTYSSIFIASPAYLFLQRRKAQKAPVSTQKPGTPAAATPAPEEGERQAAVDIAALKREIGWKGQTPRKEKKKKGPK